MKKEYRIKKPEEFQKIIERKRFITNKEFVLYYQPKTEQTSRYGVSVGKKLGNAVFRNKFKRQVRMMIAKLYQENYRYDVIIIVRQQYLENNYQTNYQSLNRILVKINSKELNK